MNDTIGMYAHGSSYNHGCEAIVRSTTELLSLDKAHTILYSDNLQGDLSFHLDEIVTLKECIETPVSSSSLLGMRYRMQAHLAKDRDFAYQLHQGKHRYRYLLEPHKAALSIGGDNYCYRGGLPSLMIRNYWLHKKGIPTILWGASLMEEFITDPVLEDLNRYAMIVAREELTYLLLNRLPVKTKIIQAPDPAFSLKTEAIEWPDGKAHQHVIGVNISPYVKLRAENSTIGVENYRALIQWVLRETDCEVALIPHVVFPNSENNDVLVQNELLETLGSCDGRVFSVPEHLNCCQLKGIISKCELFVGARTHATIAAYSSLVPTLVVGYSSKSVGIARDLFGTDSGYVVPVQKMEREDALANAFSKLYEDRQHIKQQLARRLPGYCEGYIPCVESMRQFL